MSTPFLSFLGHGQVNAWEPRLSSLSDEELRARAGALRERAREGVREGEQVLEELLPEAFAVVREASRRTLQLRHFDVQILGGIALHRGQVAEMATGEGKTLVAILPAFLNALMGKGVHVVTTNDYLARRDAAWVGQVHGNAFKKLVNSKSKTRIRCTSKRPHSFPGFLLDIGSSTSLGSLLTLGCFLKNHKPTTF